MISISGKTDHVERPSFGTVPCFFGADPSLRTIEAGPSSHAGSDGRGRSRGTPSRFEIR